MSLMGVMESVSPGFLSLPPLAYVFRSGYWMLSSSLQRPGKLIQCDWQTDRSGETAQWEALAACGSLHWEPQTPRDKHQGRGAGGWGKERRRESRGGGSLLWDRGTTSGDRAEEVFQGMWLVIMEWVACQSAMCLCKRRDDRLREGERYSVGEADTTTEQRYRLGSLKISSTLFTICLNQYWLLLWPVGSSENEL